MTESPSLSEGQRSGGGSARLSPLTLLPLALVVIGFVADARIWLRPERGLAIDAVKKAAELVRSQRKPGDIVVHSPLLTMRELEGLGTIEARPDLPSEEMRASRRVLLIDLADQPMGGFGSPSETTPIGPITLRVFEPSGGASPILFELGSELSQARAWIERPEGQRVAECNVPRSEGGFACPGQADWIYLARRTLNIDGGSQECVWAHPTTGGAVVIELPALPRSPPGRRLELSVSSALDDQAVRTTPDGATVTTVIRQDGKDISRVILPNKIGWSHTTVEIRPELPVELRVTSPRDGRRHHCVRAVVKEEAVR